MAALKVAAGCTMWGHVSAIAATSWRSGGASVEESRGLGGLGRWGVHTGTALVFLVLRFGCCVQKGGGVEGRGSVHTTYSSAGMRIGAASCCAG